MKVSPNPQVQMIDPAVERQPTFRVRLNGIPPGSKVVPGDSELPALVDVWKDVENIDRLLNGSITSFLLNRTHPGFLQCHTERLVQMITLPNLFKFSFLVDEEDMPNDLVESAIYALQTLKHVMEEATEDQVLARSYLVRGKEDLSLSVRRLHISNCAIKLSSYLMSPQIKRSQEAVDLLEELVQFQEKNNSTDDWMEDPFLYVRLGEAHLRAGNDLQRGKHVLQRALAGGSMSAFATQLATGHLVRILHSLKEDSEAEALETKLIKWYRKNSLLFSDKQHRRLLLIDDRAPTRILQGLGGMTWLQNRRSTNKSERRAIRACNHCEKGPPDLELSKCANCKSKWYCSRACQKADWSFHKQYCKETSNNQLLLDQIALVDPDAAEREADWAAWSVATNLASAYARVHALGVQRDPSRGRTHILFQLAEWNEKSKTVRDKFRITACAVFKLSDALPELERRMGLDKGEGIKRIQHRLAMANTHGDDYIPILVLTYREEGGGLFNGGGLYGAGLKELEYNANWRADINSNGDPPLILQIESPTRLQDVEYEF